MTDTSVEETWVNTTEAAEITGYNNEHVRLIARDNWNRPESERRVRVRRRSNRYDIWLPDLIKYMKDYGYGPHSKRREKQHK